MALARRQDTWRLHERKFSPEKPPGFLLQNIKRDAEAFLDVPVAGSDVCSSG